MIHMLIGRKMPPLSTSNVFIVSEKKFCREGLTIKDVALEMGTNQNYNFSRWFRVVTDMTPFQYRRSQLSGK